MGEGVTVSSSEEVKKEKDNLKDLVSKPEAKKSNLVGALLLLPMLISSAVYAPND